MQWFCRAIAVAVASVCSVALTMVAQAQVQLVKEGGSGKIIIFVHGLSGNADETFRPAPDQPSWLDLMSTDVRPIAGQVPMSEFSTAIVRYPAGSSDRLTLPDIAKLLLEDLGNNPFVAKQKDLYFVGHSAGGLIAKAIISSSAAANDPKHRSIYDKTRSVFFVATPGSGAWLADVASRFPSTVTGRLLSDLRSLSANTYLQLLNELWTTTLERPREGGTIRLFCAFERKPIAASLPWFKAAAIVVVPQHYSEASCRDQVAMNEDHFSIAKPKSVTDDIYVWLQRRLADDAAGKGQVNLNAAHPLPPQKDAPAVKATELSEAEAIFECARATGSEKYFSGIDDGEVNPSLAPHAVHVCEQALRASPDDARVHLFLGRAYHAAKTYDKSFQHFQKAADLGEVAAINELGAAYASGSGVKQDYAKAKEFFSKASVMHYPLAYVNLGALYANGLGVKKDFLTARERYERAIQAKVSRAYVGVGQLYETGDDIGIVIRDLAKAREWYQKAVDSGDANGMYLLGWMHERGNGGPKDVSKARDMYAASAALGYVKGIVSLGRMHRDGIGAPKDYDAARRQYEEGARQGHSGAMSALGGLYLKGLGVRQDRKTAKAWMEKSMELGDIDAMTTLGLMYDADGEDKNIDAAHALFQKAAALGQDDAMMMLGTHYEYGRGVKQDLKKAREWHEKAAELGNGTSMMALADMYMEGEGVKKDVVKGRKWFEKAVEQHEFKAMVSLGVIYETALGVPKNCKVAIDWFTKALKAGYGAADIHLDRAKKSCR
jgi:uncharacterized protein